MSDAGIAEHSENTAPPRVVGRPFPKGVSGNPGGRTSLEYEFRELCRTYSPEAVETLLGVMRKEKAMSSAKVQAARVLLAYAWGAPKGTDETSQDNRLIINILQLAAQSKEATAVNVRRLATDDA